MSRNKEKDTKYLNFPVQLLAGMLQDKRIVLSNILVYSLYSYSIKFGGHQKNINSFVLACKFYELNLKNLEEDYSNGEILYNSIPVNSPFVGLTISTWHNYSTEYKTPFEIACLLAFLAIKSIIGKKAYCRFSNEFLLSRMDGEISSVTNNQLSPEIQKYGNYHQVRKLKRELVENWGLKYTTGKGTYASFVINQEDLEYHRQKRALKYIEAKQKKERGEAKKRALEKITNEVGK